jgi:hypothetical protein
MLDAVKDGQTFLKLLLGSRIISLGSVNITRR